MKRLLAISISSAVVLMAGSIGMAQSPGGRAMMSENLNLFVAPPPTGSDVNSDCAHSTSPCQTIQRAVNVAATKDFGGHSIMIHLADGTYDRGAILSGGLAGRATGALGGAGFLISGNIQSPGSVVVADTSTNPAAFIGTENAHFGLQGITITSAKGSAIFPETHAGIVVSKVIFGTTHFGHMHAETGGSVTIVGDYGITGGAPAHIEAVLGGRIIYLESPHTVTLTGTPHFSTAFVSLDQGSVAYVNHNFVAFRGSATGARYLIKGNSVLETEGGEPSFLPGDSPGTLLTGGQYQPALSPTLSGTTGLGSGGSLKLVSGSIDADGTVQLTTGASASATGAFSINFAGLMGPHNAVCAFSVSDGTGHWQATATVHNSGSSKTLDRVAWSNAGVALGGRATYYVNYICQPI
jgi:hypothetical protein